MHYYKKNIGDYHKKAGRLSMLQHGAYTLLIDSCYDREVFPTIDEAIEWTWASTPDEVAAVKFVLGRFFTVEDGVYVQKRILSELDKYHKNALTNKRIAIERESKRKGKGTKRVPVVDEAPPNHKPITNNQEPLKDLSLINDGFTHWWNLYPVSRRKNKGGCFDKFKAKCKKLKDDQEVIDLINTISNDIDKRIKEAEDIKFMPATETYLNQERWKDGE